MTKDKRVDVPKKQFRFPKKEFRVLTVVVEKDKVNVILTCSGLHISALVITGKDIQVSDWWGWGSG